MTQVIPQLSSFAAVPDSYRHTEKSIVPADDLALPGAYLKWYDVYLADRPTPAQIRDEARAFLHAEAESGRLELRDELGYAMLHLDGEGYFLIVCVWRNTNEMWQVLYGRNEDGSYRLYPVRDAVPRATQNIFELDATSHERRAWSRYLSSARDEAAKRAYVEDRCTGILV